MLGTSGLGLGWGACTCAHVGLRMQPLGSKEPTRGSKVARPKTRIGLGRGEAEGGLRVRAGAGPLARA